MFEIFFHSLILLIFFWAVRTTKAVLFWLYLWQLKEYHTGRFKAHFQTEKGKRLIWNKIFIGKLFLLVSFSFLFSYAFFILLFVYFIELSKALLDFLRKRIKKPVLTKKTVFLIIFNLSFVFLIAAYIAIQTKMPLLQGLGFWLLLIDILIPLVVSLIVLLSQPLTVLLRNRVLEKAKKKREQFKDLIVIGITGSYGKTSTKEFLYTILSEKFKVLKTKEHQNSEIGIAQCILNDLKLEHKIFICEMGAYNKGGIKLLCDIVKPKIGVLTGINEQHMATFGSLENIIKTKFELIESLPKDGTAFFNAKNKYCQELYEKTLIKKKLYAREQETGEEENLAGAVAVAKELGMNDQEIEQAKKKIKFGLQVEKIKNLNIINSTYSSNPHSVISHLEYLKKWQGRRVIIMPCLIELGQASKQVHQRIGQKIDEVCDLGIITTKECFSSLEKSCDSKKCQIVFLENPKEIFEKIKDFNNKNDIILLEGRLSREIINLFYANN